MDRLDRNLCAQQAAIQSAFSPMSGLPPEILRLIFIAAVDYTGGGGANLGQRIKAEFFTSMSLSHVSLRWRQVALGIKELWRSAFVSPRDPSIVPEICSRANDVSIGLSFASRHYKTLQLESSWARWISEIHIDGPAQSIYLSDCLVEIGEFLKLDKFSFGSLDWDRQIDLHCGFANTIRLELVSSCMDNLGWLTMPRLESLNIVSTGTDEVHRTFKGLADSVPNLNTLGLHWILRSLPASYEALDRPSIDYADCFRGLRYLTIKHCELHIFYKMCLGWDHAKLLALDLVLVALCKVDGDEAQSAFSMVCRFLAHS